MAKAKTRYKTLGRQVEGAAQLVLIADSGAARLLRLSGSRTAQTLVEFALLEEPSVRRPSRDLVTDRTGRVFDSGSRTGSGPRTRTRHGAQSDYDPHTVETQRFAKRLARRLDLERRKGTFTGLTIVAARHFLGVLRPLLSKPTQLWTSREIAKDLVHADDARILRTVLT